ncbi:MAG TPA: L,D-transpeptidase [Terriglobales bacterium]
MRGRTVEYGSEVNDTQSAWRAAFEVFGIIAMLLCIALSARAQSVETTTEDAATNDQPVRKIVVSIPDRKLALIEDGEIIKVYAVAVGASESPSPEGEFKIVNRLTSPTYYHPGKVIGPGADNPLGTRWMGLNRKGFGIHGTNIPSSIGKAASHGCVRMAKKDLEELFELVQVGDVVMIRGQRDDEVASIFGGNQQPTEVVASAATATTDSTVEQ